MSGESKTPTDAKRCYLNLSYDLVQMTEKKVKAAERGELDEEEEKDLEAAKLSCDNTMRRALQEILLNRKKKADDEKK